MTTFQKIKETYKNGSKPMAYIAFKADPTSNELSFDNFCLAMDKVITLNNSKSVNPNKKNN